MARRKKHSLPFDNKGGTVVIQRRLLASTRYLSLSPEAKALIALLQVHWRNDVPVAYGVREAKEKIRCAKGTAQRAFDQLQSAGFIELIDECLFCSRTQSKARTWRLTWMPYMSKFPTNEWEKLELPGQKRSS